MKCFKRAISLPRGVILQENSTIENRIHTLSDDDLVLN